MCHTGESCGDVGGWLLLLIALKVAFGEVCRVLGCPRLLVSGDTFRSASGLTLACAVCLTFWTPVHVPYCLRKILCMRTLNNHNNTETKGACVIQIKLQLFTVK